MAGETYYVTALRWGEGHARTGCLRVARIAYASKFSVGLLLVVLSRPPSVDHLVIFSSSFGPEENVHHISEYSGIGMLAASA